MKKTLLLLILSALFVFDLSAQRKPQKTNANKEKTVKIPAEPKTSANARTNARYLIYDAEGTVGQGKYYDLYHNRNYMYPDYKYEVEVTILSTYVPGKIDFSIYSDNRFVRNATPSGYGYTSYYKLGDLKQHERSAIVSIYGYKSSRFRVKIWKVKDHYQQCHYNNPLYDLAWLKDIHQKYPNYKICEYEYGGKKYFKVWQCGVSHYTVYWYDCYGQIVCQYQDNQICHEVKGYKEVKCWYTPTHCGGGDYCDYRFWYDDCYAGKEIHAGGKYYVKVNAEKYNNIQWMELYINDQKIRRESNYPYEWGKTSADHQLYNLKPGTYKLKCVVYDKCGKYKEEYCTFTVKGGGNHCNYNMWYEKGKHNSYYNKHSNVYVKVLAEKHYDIEWAELYVNGHKVRRENSAPYEWGKPHSQTDHKLNYMQPGTYYLVCKYKTKCGQYYEKKSTIYVKH